MKRQRQMAKVLSCIGNWCRWIHFQWPIYNRKYN